MLTRVSADTLFEVEYFVKKLLIFVISMPLHIFWEKTISIDQLTPPLKAQVIYLMIFFGVLIEVFMN